MTDPRREVAAGLNTGVLTAAVTSANGIIAFGPLGAEAAGFAIAAALASSALAGVALALIGASRPLIGTTTTATALATAALLAAVQPASLGAGILLAMLLALLAGLGMFGLAWAGLARLAALVPTPVTIGLMNSVVVLVVLGQAGVALGLPPGAAIDLGAAQWGSLAVTALAMALMLRPLPVLPPPAVALLAAAALHHLLGASGLPVGPVVGQTTSPLLLAEGLGEALSAWADLPAMAELLPLLLTAAASVALLATLEVLSVSTALREVTGRRVEPRPDLLGAAAGMVGAGLSGGVPASVQSSSSMACLRWGGRGRLSMLVRAGVALPVLAFAGPLIAALPYAALAGVVAGALVRLFQLGPMLPAAGPGRRRRMADALVIATVVAGAALAGLVAAVGIGVLLSVVIFTGSMAQSPVRRSLRNPSGLSRVRRPPEEERLLRDEGARIELMELEGALFFGSADRIVVQAGSSLAGGTEVLILDLHRVTRIDLSGGQRLLEALRAAPGRVLLAPLHPGGRARAELEAIGLLARLPAGIAFPNLAAAVEAAEEMLLDRLRPGRQGGARGAGEALEALGMPHHAAAALLARSREERYADGEPILRQGEPADCVHVLLEGQVVVSLPAAPGRPATRLAVLAPGVVFGEAALFRGGRRSADVTARGAVRSLRIGIEAAQGLREEDPDTAWHLMAAVARQLSGNLAAANATIDRLEE